jgi:glycine/D-amino acid oxidase-like deaminating enzyme
VSPYELTTKMMAAAEAAGAKVVIGTCAGVQLTDDAADGTVPQLTGITLESGEVRASARAVALCAACVRTCRSLTPLAAGLG